jgi:hypothetical protein
MKKNYGFINCKECHDGLHYLITLDDYGTEYRISVRRKASGQLRVVAFVDYERAKARYNLMIEDYGYIK